MNKSIINLKYVLVVIFVLTFSQGVFAKSKYKESSYSSSYGSNKKVGKAHNKVAKVSRKKQKRGAASVHDDKSSAKSAKHKKKKKIAKKDKY